MNVKLILMTACFLLPSLAVNAASHRKMVFVNQYDLDGDWMLFAGEFEHARKRRFNNTDENQDGVVNEAEYVFEYQNKLDTQLKKDRKGQVQQTIVRFNALDKNENDMMEWQEYEASGLRSFTRYDVNKDGNIDTQDLDPVNKWKGKGTAEMSKQQQEKQRDRQLASAKRSLSMPSTHNKKGMFIKYDNNQDGVITKAEHQLRRRADFDLTDEDNNGWLSQDEYLFEYQNRMDKQIAKTRTAAIKQTYVRFGVLDKDENGQMTIEEYQFSGHRSFNRWDSDKNKIVTMNEALPEPRKKSKTQPSSAQVVAVNE
jgi:Ca2+-binding EF-hand superfamily protein